MNIDNNWRDLNMVRYPWDQSFCYI